MSSRPGYSPEITEVHHIQKLDAPSGTAIRLAEDMTEILPGKETWTDKKKPEKNEVPVTSKREGTVVGTHTIKYDSKIDYIEITHSAKSREGLALGAVLAAEYCMKNKGILNMKDMLKI